MSHHADNTRFMTRSGVLGHQLGISLIEIMVGLALSLFLLLGLFAIFDSTRQLYGMQTGLAQLQEKQRTAIALVSGVIQSAGYFTPPASQILVSEPDAIRRSVFPASTNSTYTAGAAVFGTEVTASKDTVQVRFQTAGGSNIPNCQGDTNTGSTTITYDNAFSVNGSNQLVCAVGTNGGTLGTATVLVDGVSGMDVLYGIDTKGIGSSSQYVAADSVTDWSKVRSIKMQLTFVNPSKGSAGQPDSVSNTQIIQLIGTP